MHAMTGRLTTTLPSLPRDFYILFKTFGGCLSPALGIVKYIRSEVFLTLIGVISDSTEAHRCLRYDSLGVVFVCNFVV